MRRTLRLAKQVSVALSVLDSAVVVVDQVRTVRRRLAGAPAAGVRRRSAGSAAAAGTVRLLRSAAPVGVLAASAVPVAVHRTRRRSDGPARYR